MSDPVEESRRREERALEAASPWRKLFDWHPAPMWVVDTHTLAIVDVNDAALALYGYGRDQFLALTARDLEAHPDEDEVAVRLQMAFGGAEPAFVSAHRRRDGTVFDVELRLVPLEVDRTASAVFVGRPVDDARALALALREVSERFDLAARATTDVVYDWNVPTGAIWWNDNLHAVLRFAPGTVGPSIDWWTAQLHPDDRDRVEETLGRSIAGRRPVWASEYRFRRGDGTWASVLDRGYLVFDAEGHPLRMIGAMEDITERREAEEALRRSEERFRAFIERSSDILTLLDASSRVTFCSPSLEASVGYRPAEVIGRPLTAYLHPDDVSRVTELLGDLGRVPGAAARFDARFCHRDGSWRTFESVARNLCHVPAVSGIVVNSRDLTDRHRLEAQLLHAQKMDAVGRLAGGIAHDFNNLLMAIGGYAEMAADQLGPSHPVVPDLEHIRYAAGRAAGLTRQLLAFGRKAASAPALVDLNGVVRGAQQLLQRLIGEDIELAAEPTPGLWPVRIDPLQFEQVLINLAVNARDAMPTGGRLALSTANVRAPGAGTEPNLAPGDWVRLTVSDTGIGMDEATRAHAFEPFFTTKGPGKGTGLGLATCHGIVTQHGGHIGLGSVPGAGTTVSIFLPRARGTVSSQASASVAPASLDGTETVFVVEDEALVRELAVRCLGARGYRVLQAEDGLAALEVARAFDGPIDLLVTDVVMPHMSGPEMAKRLVVERPTTRVIYTSGYTDDALIRHGAVDPSVDFLAKPYTPEALAAMVRSVLEREVP